MPSVSYLTNQLSPHEEENKWELLTLETIGEKGWTVMDTANPVTNVLKRSLVLNVDATQGERPISLPNILNSYELIADIQMAPGTKGRINYPTGGNQQMLCMSSFAIFDDTTLDYKNSDADYLMGSIIGKASAKNLSEVTRKKRVLKPDAWQRIRIVVKGSRVQHWLNMVKVADYTRCPTKDSKTPANTDIQIKLNTGFLNIRTAKYRPL